ncbi:MAG: transposase, partial [Bacilli bacterium]|nr:transposase [Bacilli bacterium]
SRKELIYTKSSTSKSFIFKDNFIYITVSYDLNKGRMKLCKVPKYLKDKDFDSEIKYMEIVPKNGFYELHIKYEVPVKEANNLNSDWCSIDLGMNNLMAVTSNVHKSYLINGRSIKSINQRYNKQIAKLQSETKRSNNKFKSKELNRLFSKRGDKLNNEIHKITDFIVKSIIKNKIDYVVIGYNKEWKQNIDLGKRTNQNFVQIPFSKIINHLTYKLQLEGIEVHLQEESYTSKCSYFDSESINKHKTYKGNRTNRGLFITSNGIKINADVNGSLNIHKKFISKAVNDVHIKFEPVDIGLVMNPIKINLRTDFSLEEIYSLIVSL